MTREELSNYIDNSILIGNVITEDSPIYKLYNDIAIMRDATLLLGSVNAEGFYVKKDSNNKICLVYHDAIDYKYEDIDLGDCIDIIEAEAFAWNHRVKRVTGKSVVEIGDSSFSSSDIELVNFPNLKKIGFCAFYMSHIKEVVFNKVKIISGHAFEESDLVSFRGDKVEVVEVGGFSYCDNLQTLILPKAKEIHLGYRENTYDRYRGVTNLKIPKKCEFLYD